MSRKKQEQLPSEWCYMLAVEEIGDKPVRMTIAPNDAERTKLVQRLGLIGLDDFQADLKIARDPGKPTIHIAGELTGTVIQNCVVTLEPVKSQVHEQFEAWYADPEQAVPLAKARHDLEVRKGQREVPILDESEDPEPIVDGQIDLGELVTQYLSLSLNPYPHAEGVDYEQLEEAKAARDKTDIRKNPFAALKDWKDKLK